jgi:hypothetical protein
VRTKLRGPILRRSATIRQNVGSIPTVGFMEMAARTVTRGLVNRDMVLSGIRRQLGCIRCLVIRGSRTRECGTVNPSLPGAIPGHLHLLQ